MDRKRTLKKRISEVRSHFFPGQHPTVIHVTKKRPLEDIIMAYELGVRDFGENRVDELQLKADACLAKGITDIRWHFIGNIQSNKINTLFKIKGLYAIHSVDSLKVLKNLFERKDRLITKEVLFFIQINTSNESEKSGISDWDELSALANFYIGQESAPLHWHGLMTMGKLRTDDFQKDAQKCFSQLVKVRDTLIRDYELKDLKLSMGMSNDYQVALQEGSDYLRLGSLIYED